jgi:hypothetical protein
MLRDGLEPPDAKLALLRSGHPSILTLDSNLHLRHFHSATFLSMMDALRRYVIVGLNTLD